MKSIALIGILALILGGVSAAAAQEEAAAVCTQHLQTIGRALAAYEHDNGERPYHLSDLYPKYVADRAVFHCPADPSPGSPGASEFDDPKMPTSYKYTMVTNKAPWYLFIQLGPQPLGPDATLREGVLEQHAHFGDRAIVAQCDYHQARGTVLRLTWGGQVYRDAGWPYNMPWMAAGMVERMEHDLEGGAEPFARNWTLSSVEEYASGWIDSSLPPSLRYRLGIVADRLSIVAKALPPASQGNAYRLAARCFGAAGRLTKAITVAEEAMPSVPRPLDGHSHAETSPSPSQEQAILIGLLSDLRYRVNGKRGQPPVDEYLEAERARQHIPGLSTAVVQDGKLVLAKGYGLANVERSVPATKDTVYGIASMTKSFTATALMMLVEEGKISVDDLLSNYLPDTPAAWKEINLRRLLTHTSGIPDLGGPSPDSIIQEAAKRPLDFQPGEKWSYSNTGYTILGKVIERVTGKPLELFLDERIFRPLQMSFTAKEFTDLNLLSTGYAWEEGKAVKVNPLDRYGPGRFDRAWAFGHGGFVSTVTDLVKWDAALDTEKLLKQSSLEQMWTPAKLKDGSLAPAFGGRYGFGWMLYGAPGRRIVTHGGNTTGVSSVLMRFVDDRLTVILLTNRSDVDEFGLARGVAHLYLRPRKPLKDKDPTTSRRLKSVLQNLTDGKVDPALFTPEAQTALLPELQQSGEFYHSLGPLKPFHLIEQASEGKRETCRYRAVFRDTVWIQTFVLTEAGKIAELGVEPE